MTVATAEQDPLDRLLDYLHATPGMRKLIAKIELVAGKHHAIATAEAWWRSSRGKQSLNHPRRTNDGT